MYAINYDGDWFTGYDVNGPTFSDTLCSVEIELYQTKESAKWDIDFLVMDGQDPDAFEIVPVKIVRDDADS